MKKLILFILLLVSFFASQAQQDAQFSQYMFNGMYINPAYCGYREEWNINLFYRNQWAGFPGAPKTLSLAVDGTARDNTLGLGFQVINDKIGALNNTSTYFNYAYRIKFGDPYADDTKTLTLGLGAGFVQQHININELHADQPLDNTLMSAVHNKIMPDARFGIFYNTDRFYAGVSADNLITNFWQRKDEKQGYFIINKLHWYATAGTLVDLSDNVSWKPSFLLKDDLAGPTSLDLNSFFLLKNILWVGASYRTAVPLYAKSYLQKGLTKPADIVGMVDVFVNDKLRIGYAYDYSLNNTTTQGYSTHELSIGYFFKNAQQKMYSPRYF